MEREQAAVDVLVNEARAWSTALVQGDERLGSASAENMHPRQRGCLRHKLVGEEAISGRKAQDAAVYRDRTPHGGPLTRVQPLGNDGHSAQMHPAIPTAHGAPLPAMVNLRRDVEGALLPVLIQVRPNGVPIVEGMDSEASLFHKLIDLEMDGRQARQHVQ